MLRPFLLFEIFKNTQLLLVSVSETDLTLQRSKLNLPLSFAIVPRPSSTFDFFMGQKKLWSFLHHNFLWEEPSDPYNGPKEAHHWMLRLFPARSSIYYDNKHWEYKIMYRNYPNEIMNQVRWKFSYLKIACVDVLVNWYKKHITFQPEFIWFCNAPHLITLLTFLIYTYPNLMCLDSG